MTKPKYGISRRRIHKLPVDTPSQRFKLDEVIEFARRKRIPSGWVAGKLTYRGARPPDSLMAFRATIDPFGYDYYGIKVSGRTVRQVYCKDRHGCWYPLQEVRVRRRK